MHLLLKCTWNIFQDRTHPSWATHTRTHTPPFIKRKTTGPGPLHRKAGGEKAHLSKEGWSSPSVGFSLSKRFFLYLCPGNQDIRSLSPGVPHQPGLSAGPTSRPPLPPVCHKSSWSLDTLQPASETGYLWVLR